MGNHPAVVHLAAALAGTLLTALLLKSLIREAAGLGLLKRNYEGEPLVSSLGLALWAAAMLAFGMEAILRPHDPVPIAFAAVGFAAGLLGWLDDRWGSRAVGGFRGHFGELRRGRLTTGAAKALCFPPMVFLAALFELRQSVLSAMLTMLVTSLTANLINLLDTRPNRAVRAWMAGAVGVCVVAPVVSGAIWPLGVMFGPVMVYLPIDREKRGMMGDVGANLLGAILGLSLAVSTPFLVRVGALALLVGVHHYSEKHSLGAVIESTWWLGWLTPGGFRR